MILSELIALFELGELIRPWKLATFGVGLTLLILGAKLDIAPDWDYGVSIAMALTAYIAAPWVVRSLSRRRWWRLPACVILSWWGVDGCYALYWSLRNPEILDQLRSAQWPTSACLFLMCGLAWMHAGPLKYFLTREQHDLSLDT